MGFISGFVSKNKGGKYFLASLVNPQQVLPCAEVTVEA
jgi:hypothetical protein